MFPPLSQNSSPNSYYSLEENVYCMRKMIAIVPSVIIILLLSIPHYAQAITISIEVDNIEKSVHPGETAFFLWIIGNEEDMYTIDFHISSEPETIFNITDFTVRPGEEQLVNQMVETLKSDENGTEYDIYVHFEGEYYLIQPIPGHPNEVPPVGSGVIVTVLNDSNESIEPNQFENNYTSDDHVMILGIISLFILAVVMIIIYIWRKKG